MDASILLKKALKHLVKFNQEWDDPKMKEIESYLQERQKSFEDHEKETREIEFQADLNGGHYWG